jgi:hypothetical protein
MSVLQSDKVTLNNPVKLYKQLFIRTEFILQQDKNLDEDYVLFLKQLRNDPDFEDFESEIDEDIQMLEVTDIEVNSLMKTIVRVPSFVI